MVAKETSLTRGEQNRLAAHEEVIDRGLNSFVEVGRALMAIRDEHLYTDVDGTFEGYCKKRWGFAKSRAYQLIDAAKVVDVVSTIVDTPPANEAQARVLADLPSEQAQATVWAKAVETAPKDKDGTPRVTAAHVKAVAAEVAPNGKAKPKAEPKPEPAQDTDEGGYEKHEALKPLGKMDALLTKMMEQLSAAERILGKPALAAVHGGLDATHKGLQAVRKTLRRAG